jgi:LAO/AO transport system kinase
VKLADLILVVLTPGAGDEIQAFKAGIMEIADIFVLNKADSPGTERMERQLRAMIEMGLQKKDIPPVVRTVATKGKGLDALMAEVARLTGTRNQKLQEARRKRLLSWMLRDVIKEKIFEIISQNISDSALEKIVDKIYDRRTDPYTVADEFIASLKDKS